MDTKLRKFKYSFFTKFLCWLTAVLLFCFSLLVGVKVTVGMYFLGVENVLENRKTDFFFTNPVIAQVNSDVYGAISLGRQNVSVYEKTVQENKSIIIDKIADKFLDDKAAMIKSELEYAVRNFDDSYYAYDDTVPVTEEGEFTTSVYVPSDYPESIKLAVQVLANAKGRDFLKYDGLVRTDAFEAALPCEETIIFADNSILRFHFDIVYGYDESNIKKYLSMCYDEQAEAFLSNHRVDGICADHLSERQNLKYYIENYDGEVYSNINSIPINICNYNYYIFNLGEKVEVKGLEPYKFEEFLKDNPCKKLCIYFENDLKYDDIYKSLYDAYNRNLSDDFNKLIIVFGVSFVLSLILLVLWLSLCGRRADKEDATTSSVDKIPNDIHFMASFGLIAGLTVLACLFVSNNWHDMNFYEYKLEKFLYVLLFVYLFLCTSVFTEWLASVVRVVKSKNGYFKNTLIARLIMVIIKPFKKMKTVFAYKPKKMRIRTILCFVAYVAINLVSAALSVILISGIGPEPVIGALVLICDILFNVFAIYEFTKFINHLDVIIDASSKSENIDFGNQKVPDLLKLLAENICNSNDKLNVAIAEAVKNEHMKTQLITNVSHDLKTPLTSLISYSDLLSKCDIEGDDAKKYVDVINQQSVKLKRLIEDLIEASKVSTGNVTLNKTKINLSELAVQAIVEFTPDFEKNGNEVKFSEPERPPVVFADGTKAYRILSNLLSNAKKYSAPDTRIYASVYKDGNYGCFEIKNISKEPLNISANELTERFVRGDESRTNEGNGLGLSIAKDLCSLQNGTLDIIIDGDLFKVVVKLPVNDN